VHPWRFFITCHSSWSTGDHFPHIHECQCFLADYCRSKSISELVCQDGGHSASAQ
jgi:hypothetical protein